MPPYLSVVIPAFNEESGIITLLERMVEELERLERPWEIVVADDGSGDRTAAVVEQYARREPRVRLVRGNHRGKGAAVARGMAAARGAWRFMADADLSMPPDNLRRFLAAVSSERPLDVIIGSREAAGAERIGERWQRHVIGRVFNTLVRALVVPGIQDTQCGYKLFSAEAAERLFPRLTLQGFAFDVELLFVARRHGLAVRELGIVWHSRTDSRVGVGRGAAAFADLLRIRWRAWRGAYD